MNKQQYEDKGITIITNYKEYISMWDGNNNVTSCDICGASEVKCSDFENGDTCFSCYKSYWKKGFGTYQYASEKISEYEAAELWDKYIKEGFENE